MKTSLQHFITTALAASALVIEIHAQSLSLTLERRGEALTLSWPASIRKADGTLARPFFELQSTTDLDRWQPFGERLRAALPSDALLQMSVPVDSTHAFYRLLSIEPRAVGKLADGGAEVFGYGGAFARELERIGQISPDTFASMFPHGANYSPCPSWDPTTARHWELFNADPAVVNADKQWGAPGFRISDFRLNQEETSVFKRNGFVVTPRLGSSSFGDVFYNIWLNDLPVFVSTDAILQAWHRSFDSMLEEVEETFLFNTVEQMLEGMAARVPEAWAEAGTGVLKDSVLDADYFLAVARSLLADKPVATALNQDARVAGTLGDIAGEQLMPLQDFFGTCRVVDFSQFKVRGHYTHTERLGRYFKCVMWLGRTDFVVAGDPVDRGCGPEPVKPRDMGTAIVFWNLLNRSGQFPNWLTLDNVIQAFVGWSDSMTFAQLGGVLAGAGIHSLTDVPYLATIEGLQADLLRGELGAQNIRSDYFISPLGSERVQLPRTFLVFGQKFVPDSWAFSQTVFDSILRNENGTPTKVPRRVPGALDVAFAVLGNDQVVPDLVSQMKGTFVDPQRPHALKFRDGLPYQHNLAAVRAVIDSQKASAWESNLYLGWLAALRELSAPTTDQSYPEVMRTRAWAMKTLNTQLAS